MAKESSDRILEAINQESITEVTVIKENQSYKTLDDDDNNEEPVERSTSSRQEQQLESDVDTENEDSRIQLYDGKTRRDSGWYPPNWNTLLNANEPLSPTLAGITEVCMCVLYRISL